MPGRRGARRGKAARASFDIDKPLYTIGVASEILETLPRTLMLYEDVHLIEPFRTQSNRRRYSQRDIRKLQVIQAMTREKGINLAGVRHIFSLFQVLQRQRVPPPEDLQDVYGRYSELM